MIKAYEKFWKNYINFSDRSSRSDYWYVFLVNLIISAVISAAAAVVPVLGYLSGVYGLISLIPGIALAVRRMHDTDRSGWCLLVAFIPIVGSIIVIVWLASAGKPDANAYGENPLNE